MHKPLRFYGLIAFLILTGLLLVFPWQKAQGQAPENTRFLTGTVYDRQEQLVADARVSLHAAENHDSLTETLTQPDGRYTLTVPTTIPDQLTVRIEREHFQPIVMPLNTAVIQS